ncbi:MAG: alpha-1,2-fucosyltransferase [Lachnospiraceae bacterium]|nr:alpha-1,2-fucosyltransferase [Lachnospiraceae bacterium]
MAVVYGMGKQAEMRNQYKDLSIVQLSGGLGNQMFQYAFYRQLQEMGRKVKMDDTTEYQYEGCRKPQLDVFGISYDRCTREELVALTDAYMTPVDRMRRKLFGRRTRLYHERQFNFDPKIYERGSTYFEGCWQTEKYFKGIESLLRESFTFKGRIPETTKAYLQQIQRDQEKGIVPVSIHIRRGDYLVESTQALYGNICTEAYYEKAIQMIYNRLGSDVPTNLTKIRFYIFSNDIPWAKEHYRGEQYVVVDCNDESTGYLDMMLMSTCRHHIIANSSFSWWGAWLNPSPDKIVIAPPKWLNGRDCEDIYSGSMIPLTEER